MTLYPGVYGQHSLDIQGYKKVGEGRKKRWVGEMGVWIIEELEEEAMVGSDEQSMVYTCMILLKSINITFPKLQYSRLLLF